MNETIETYAFVCYGIAGAPPDKLGMHVTDKQDDQPRKLSTWAKQSYWALSSAQTERYPAVLMHVYFEGELPSDAVRDEINRHVQRLTGQLLFNEK